MKNKIISWVIWAIIWWILVFWYSNLFTEGQNNNIWDKNMWPEWNGWVRMDIDSSNISDDQLEKMAERAGISIDELKEDFSQLSELKVWEEEIVLDEGKFHSGNAAVVRLIGKK